MKIPVFQRAVENRRLFILSSSKKRYTVQMMKDAISHFAEQFELPLKIQNPSKKRFKKFIVAGMGGSHLGADLIKTIDPSLDLMIHSSYGLPTLQRDQWKDRFVIASSYSGNTEETIDAFFEARKRKFPLA